MKSNLIEGEIERRKKRVGGYARLQQVVSRVKENAPVVAAKVRSATANIGSGIVRGAEAVDKAHDKIQDWRLKKIQAQTQINKAKKKRDRYVSRNEGRPNTFALDSSNHPIFGNRGPSAPSKAKKKPKGIIIQVR